MSDLSGIWVALVTPFRSRAEGHRVDHDALRLQVRRLREAHVTGLVALGSTGEAASLEDHEQNAVLDTVLDAAAGLPVMAGLAGNHTGQLHDRLAHLNTLPLHALLSPAPYYVRPSQAGLLDHFHALADASRTPVVLYDIPYRTGVQLEQETLLALAEHDNIVGIKDCGGSLDKTQALIADGRLQVLAGEDALIFHNLCLGGAGAITAAAQIAPERFMAMFRALKRGDLAVGRALHHDLAPLIHALFSEPNPAVVKAAMSHLGLGEAHLRPPMVAASPCAAQQIATLLHGMEAPAAQQRYGTTTSIQQAMIN